MWRLVPVTLAFLMPSPREIHDRAMSKVLWQAFSFPPNKTHTFFPFYFTTLTFIKYTYIF